MAETLRWTFGGTEGVGGRLVLWSVLAGGICGGGLLIGALAMTGRGSPGLHLLLAPILFLMGSVVGLVHGTVLTVVTRPGGVSRSKAWRRVLFAGIVSIPLLPLSWLISSSITVGTALQVERRVSWMAVSVGGAVVGVVVCAFAVRECWRAIAGAVRRRMGE